MSYLHYAPAVAVALFLNTADIYFLQPDRFPQLHRAPSYWLYMIGHALVALGAAFLLFEKSGVPAADWPVVTMVAALSGFSVLQSWTLKFGEWGIDARELFDAWKRRVIEDVSQSNTSRKRAKQMRVAQSLVRGSAANPAALDAAVVQIAPTLRQDPKELLESFAKSGANAQLMKAQWVASVDLEFAQNLSEMLAAGHGPA
jgi:hypothetical protein